MKMLIRLAAVAALALGANVASAVPFAINVTTLGGSSSGSWSLTGPTSQGSGWTHSAPFGTNTWSGNILAGDYDWALSGNGTGGLFGGLVGWTLFLNNRVIDSGAATGGTFRRYSFTDSGEFTAIPEPASLALLGLGLAGLGLVRRKRSA